jgi:hypothetical protein
MVLTMSLLFLVVALMIDEKHGSVYVLIHVLLGAMGVVESIFVCCSNKLMKANLQC